MRCTSDGFRALLVAVFALALTGAAHAQAIPRILSVVPDLSGGNMTIAGVRLAGGVPGMRCAVSLGGLVLDVQTCSDDVVVTALPPLADGDYLLHVEPHPEDMEPTWEAGPDTVRHMVTVALLVQGPLGELGPQGAIGEQGVPGSAGQTVAGARVLQGGELQITVGESVQTLGNITGGQGLIGLIGPQGPVGEIGSVGARGVRGVVGSQGVRGPQGPEGPIGAIGPQGIPGEVGAQGAAGSAAQQGPVGLIGPAGPQGQPGEMGPQGEQGGVGLPGVLIDQSRVNDGELALDLSSGQTLNLGQVRGPDGSAAQVPRPTLMAGDTRLGEFLYLPGYVRSYTWAMDDGSQFFRFATPANIESTRNYVLLDLPVMDGDYPKAGGYGSSAYILNEHQTMYFTGADCTGDAYARLTTTSTGGDFGLSSVFLSSYQGLPVVRFGTTASGVAQYLVGDEWGDDGFVPANGLRSQSTRNPDGTVSCSNGNYGQSSSTYSYFCGTYTHRHCSFFGCGSSHSHSRYCTATRVIYVYARALDAVPASETGFPSPDAVAGQPLWIDYGDGG